MKPVKDIIKEKRLEHGLTMKELAQKVGVSEGTISRWESGEIANMRRSAMVSLSKVLDIPPETLMGWDSDTPIEINDSDNKEIMAKNIKYYMDLHGKSRKDMCNDLGFVYSTFSDWLNGKKYPRIDKIEMMANYFGISKADLVERHTNKSNSSGYYTDPEVAQLAEELRTNPEKRILFDASKDLSKDDIDIVLNLIHGLKAKEGKNEE